MSTESATDVVRERLLGCRASADLWVNELPRYASRQQKTADSWAIAAGVLAAATSLTIWPVIGEDSTALVKWVVTAAAMASAICALIPRVKNYADYAAQARELATQYGTVVGPLTDLTAASTIDQAGAAKVIEAFEAAKARKDQLRDLPDRDAVGEKRARLLLRRIEAEAAAQRARESLLRG